jgi:predicted anti-sigma-YlaC factor YlaD
VNQKRIHLEEDRIMASVIDEADLSPAEKEHLSECSGCREKKEKIQEEFALLGNLSEQFAPEPKRPFLRKKREPRPFLTSAFGWKLSLASAVAVLFAITATWYFSKPLRLQNSRQNAAEWTAATDQELMSEINAMAEDAFPRTYLYITGEYHKGLNDEFIRFIVPPVNNDSVSHLLKMKGRAAC